jgi:hypothetical protein
MEPFSKKSSNGRYEILIKAKIEEGWHLYTTKLPDGGPLPTSFTLPIPKAINR